MCESIKWLIELGRQEKMPHTQLLDRAEKELQEHEKAVESLIDLLGSHHEMGFVRRAAENPMTFQCELCGNGKSKVIINKVRGMR